MCTGPDTEQPPPSSPLGELQEMCREPYSHYQRFVCKLCIYIQKVGIETFTFPCSCIVHMRKICYKFMYDICRRGYRSRWSDPVVLGAMRELSRKKMEGYVATMFIQLKGYFMHTYSGIKLVSLRTTFKRSQTLNLSASLH